ARTSGSPGPGWGARRCGCCLRRPPGCWRSRAARGRSGGACAWCRWDGTTLDVQDTGPNWERFGAPSTKEPSGKKLRGAFPQVRLLALAECGTRALIAACCGGYRTGEKTLARQLLTGLQAGMLLLADANFACYELWRDAAAGGAEP